MRVKKLISIVLIIVICILSTGNQKAYCAEVYQTETGVTEEAWGPNCGNYLRQMMIKYNINQNPSITDLLSLDAPEVLKEYLKAVFVVFKIIS